MNPSAKNIKTIRSQIQINPQIQSKVITGQFTWNDLALILGEQYEYEFTETQKEEWTIELNDIFSCLRMM